MTSYSDGIGALSMVTGLEASVVFPDVTVVVAADDWNFGDADDGYSRGAKSEPSFGIRRGSSLYRMLSISRRLRTCSEYLAQSGPSRVNLMLSSNLPTQ